VVSKVYNNPNRAEREGAKKILAWVICCKRPLKWRELQATFSIELASQTVDFEDRKLRVTCKDLCGSLIDVRSAKFSELESGNTIELVHETARM
jgi:hypothetical protein